MDIKNDKWRDIFPEIKDEYKIEHYFETYVDEKFLDKQDEKKYNRNNIDDEIFFRIEKVIDKDCPFRKIITWLLSGFYQEFVGQIECYQDIVEMEDVINDVLRYMGQRLLTMVVRTFVQEIRICEETNKLVGVTEKERYDYYDERLSTSKRYLFYLEEQYPVLFKMSDHLIWSQIKYVSQILGYISQEKQEIAKLLGKDRIGKVKSIKLGLGDSHCGGKTVAEIKFEYGEVIYKPRNLYMERQWNSLTKLFNKKLGKSVLLSAKTISKVDHGFMEKIIRTECHDAKEVENFFYHSGCLLAVLYSLNASDCHFENIITVGAYPVLVDAELLLGINPNERQDDRRSIVKAIKTLYYSVARVGLLPFQVSLGKRKIDIGGIGKTENGTASVKSLVLKEKNSVHIHFEYEERTLKSQENVLAYDKVDEKKNIEYMIMGFEEVYDYIFQHKKEYITSVISLFRNASIRVLYTPTMVYSNLLGISYHFMFMKSQLDRMKLLSRIAMLNKENKPLVKSDMKMLYDNDIPYYSIDFTPVYNFLQKNAV